MAPYTYYYCISLVLVIGALLWIVNLIYLRIKGKTMFRQSYKKDTSDYKRVIKVASNQSIIISALFIAMLTINLLNSIRLLAQLNTSTAHDILVYAPAVIVMVYMLVKNSKTTKIPIGMNKTIVTYGGIPSFHSSTRYRSNSVRISLGVCEA